MHYTQYVEKFRLYAESNLLQNIIESLRPVRSENRSDVFHTKLIEAYIILKYESPEGTKKP